jgi:hypothetical protein
MGFIIKESIVAGCMYALFLVGIAILVMALEYITKRNK